MPGCGLGAEPADDDPETNYIVVADGTAPAPPFDFKARVLRGTIQLTWVNPNAVDFAQVSIRRSTTGYPASLTDGDLVYEGEDTSFVDTDVVPQSTYYYRAVAHDRAGNVSPGASAAATPGSPGDLDRGFNGSGFVTHYGVAGENGDSGNGVAIDAGGRIFVVGASNKQADADMVLLCHDDDGRLDTAFAGDGVVVYNNAAGGGGADGGNAVAIDAQGRVVVAGRGTAPTSNTQLVVWRFRTDGTPDPTFGGGSGRVVYGRDAGGGNDDVGTAVTLDSQGRIIVAGFSDGLDGSWDMIIWRLGDDGSLDGDFAGAGFVASHDAAGGGADDAALGVAVDATDRILATGYSRNSGGTLDLAVWRYTAAGLPDTTFNGTGIMAANFATSGDLADTGSAILVDGAGRILVTGDTNTSGNADMLLLRLTADGALDSTFGTAGVQVSVDPAGGDGVDFGAALAVDVQGHVFVAGQSTNGRGNGDMALWSFGPDGAPDTAFGKDGVLLHGGASGRDATDGATAIAIDAAGRIVVAGTSGIEITIWRINP